MSPSTNGLTAAQRFVKHSFDTVGAAIGLSLFWWLILAAFVASTIDTRKNGFFTQTRVGKDGKLFKVIKIRTMRTVPGFHTTITSDIDPRITPLGRFFRKTKIDELPQLINILLGHMSFVGPRPDVPGYAGRLEGEDRIILSMRPGITGPATLKYRNEEQLLAGQADPERYNDEVIFPDKAKLNRDYVLGYSFWKDIKYILQTVWGK